MRVVTLQVLKAQEFPVAFIFTVILNLSDSEVSATFSIFSYVDSTSIVNVIHGNVSTTTSTNEFHPIHTTLTTSESLQTVYSIDVLDFAFDKSELGDDEDENEKINQTSKYFRLVSKHDSPNFCPEQSLHDIHDYSGPTKASDIIRISRTLNGNGYLEMVHLPSPPLQEVHKTTCLQTNDKGNSRNHFYETLKKCYLPDVIILSTIRTLLNFTFVGFTQKPSEHKKMKWHLNICYGEATFLLLPNEFASTRGSYMSLGEIPVELIACVKSDSLSSFDYSFGSVFIWSWWIAIAVIVLLHMLLYRSISRGFDVTWYFLNMPGFLSHPMKVVGFTLISITIVANSYNGSLSAEFMRLADFPSFEKFVALRYRVAIVGSRKSLNVIYETSFPNATRRGLEKALGGIPFVDTLYDETIIKTYNGSFSQVVRTMAEMKLGLLGNDQVDLASMLGKSVKNVMSGYLCKVLDVKAEINLPMSLPRSVRVWGYLSQRTARLVNTWLEIGLFKFGNSFSYSHSQMALQALDMKDAATGLECRPLTINSHLGLSALYFGAFGCGLLTRFLVSKLRTNSGWINWKFWAYNTRNLIHMSQ